MIAQGICMRYRLKNKVCGPVERMVLAGGYSDLAGQLLYFKSLFNAWVRVCFPWPI